MIDTSDWPSEVPPRDKSSGLRRNIATLNISARHCIVQRRYIPAAQISTLLLMQTSQCDREPLQEAAGQHGWQGGSGPWCQGVAVVGWGWTTALPMRSFHVVSGHIDFLPLLSHPPVSEGQQPGTS